MMGHKFRLSVATLTALSLTAWSGPVLAECQAPLAVDKCLVGSWKQTGGGAAEWMRQNLKMAQVNAAPSNGTLTFNGDGTFSTSKVDSKAEVTAKDATMQATGQMSAQAAGQWSAAGGTLTLCMTSADSKGTIELKGAGGEKIKMAMPQMKPANTSMTYDCAVDTLTTTQPMPKNTTMTTTYARVQ
jgi:hypothetical protein